MKTTTTSSIAGLFWVLSLFLSLGTIEPQEITRLASVLIGLFSLGPLVFCGTPLAQKTMAAPRIGFLILLFWLLALLSCAWSVAPPISLIYLGIFSLLPATVLALLLADSTLRDAFLKTAGIGAAIVITGLSAWTLTQVFWMPEMLVNGQVRHPFANPNAFAGLLGLSFFAGIGFYFREGRTTRKAALLLTLFLILCAFFALSSRAASLTLVTGIIILMSFGHAALRTRWKPLAFLAVAVFAVQMIIAALPDRATLGQQIISFADGALSAQNRIDIWRATFDLIAAHPIFGTGYRTFFLMYPSVRLPADIYSGGQMAHSDPLQLWSEIGVLGPVLFYAISILILLRFIKFCRTNNRDVFTFALFLGCGGFVAHAHVDFLFYALTMVMVFALVLTVLLIETGNDVRQPFSFMNNWPRNLADAAIALPILAFMGLFTPLMLGEYYTVQANRMMSTFSGPGAEIKMAAAIGFGMNDRPYLLSASMTSASLIVGEYPPKVQKELFLRADHLLDKALQRNSRLAAAWFQRGYIAKNADPSILPKDYPDAESSFKKALLINPLHMASRLALADIYESRGDSKKALETLAEGVHWPYPGESAMAYYSRTERLAQSLHRDDLIPVIEKARETQRARIESARRRAQARGEAGLSTAN